MEINVKYEFTEGIINIVSMDIGKQEMEDVLRLEILFNQRKLLKICKQKYNNKYLVVKVNEYNSEHDALVRDEAPY